MVTKSGPHKEAVIVHRPTLKQTNKPHKGSKKKKDKSVIKSPAVKANVVPSKTERKNHQVQLKQLKRNKVKDVHNKEKEAATPKLLAVVPFHPTGDVSFVAQTIIKFICLELMREKTASMKQCTDDARKELEVYFNQICDDLIGKSENYKIITLDLPSWATKRRRKLQFIFCHVPQEVHEAPLHDVMSYHLEILDICKAVDGILGLFGTTSVEPGTVEPRAFSRWGYDFLSLLRKQGMPPIIGVVTCWADPLSGESWSNQSGKQKAMNLDLVKRCFDTEIPGGTIFDIAQMMCDLQSLDSETFWSSGFQQIPRKAASELINLIRHLAEVNFASFAWREGSCGYLLADQVFIDEAAGLLNLLGYTRGVGFTCRLPVHITGVGDFPLDTLMAVPSETQFPINPSQCTILSQLTDQESFMKVWQQDAQDSSMEMHAEGLNIVDDEDMSPGPTSEAEVSSDDQTDEPEEDSETEEWIKSLLEDQNETPRKSPGLQKRSRNEMEFPDEVDTPADVPCRVKFVKYRGLRNFKNSKWDTDLDRLPEWYSRIFELKPYKHMMKHIRARTMQLLEEPSSGCSKEHGTYRLLSLRIPDNLREVLVTRLQSSKAPLLVSSLGLVERKISIQHFTCVKTPEMKRAPLPSKSKLLIQCGFRRFESRPIFSCSKVKQCMLPVEVGDINGHKLAYRRYLPEEDRNSYVASIVGPTIQASNAPMIAWLIETPTKIEEEIKEKCEMEDLPLPVPLLPALSGQFVTTDPNRLIIKRILLTGYPHRIKKKACSVRRMFFNREDVQFYSPIHLFARASAGGRQKEGRIKEPLGTHGDMKCTFSEPLNHSETVSDISERVLSKIMLQVCLPLYRRVVPPFLEP